MKLRTKIWLSAATIEFGNNILANSPITGWKTLSCLSAFLGRCIIFVALTVVWLRHQYPTDYQGWFNWCAWLVWGPHTSFTTLKAMHWQRVMTSLGATEPLNFCQNGNAFLLLACLIQPVMKGLIDCFKMKGKIV